MNRWRYLAVVAAIGLLLLGGLGLTASNMQQVLGDQREFFSLDWKNHKIVLMGHPYSIDSLWKQGQKFKSILNWPPAANDNANDNF